MDYLLHTYFFNYLPFEVSQSTKKAITMSAMEIVRVSIIFISFGFYHISCDYKHKIIYNLIFELHWFLL